MFIQPTSLSLFRNPLSVEIVTDGEPEYVMNLIWIIESRATFPDYSYEISKVYILD